MVCQGASQTRFRALKHENGIAGKPTIVVRVIACFQPMEDCQVVVTVMFQTNNSWVFPQNSSWQLPKLSCINESLEPRQQECLPVFGDPSKHMFSTSLSKPVSPVPDTNPCIQVLPANMSMPGLADFSVLRAEQNYFFHEFLHQLHPCLATSLPSPGSYINEQQFMIGNGLCGRATANMFSSSWQKGLLNFDQLGSQARLNGSACPPSQHATTAITGLASSLNLHVGQAVKTIPPTLQDECGENRVIFEESEMHEDTEELNALLYSDEEDDDYDDDDDEVMSTGHSPIGIKRNYENQCHNFDIMEEVASSDGPNKRQKLLNGEIKPSVMINAACSVKSEGSHEYDSDAVSSYAIGQNQSKEMDTILLKRLSKKDKIRFTLKILESIIPGAKGKNPLLLLDESIDYLKSLKLEAETLGVNHY